MNPREQSGVALLTAVLVVTLATIIAVNLFWQSSLDQRRTSSLLAADQGWLFLLGAEAWAGDILREDLEISGDESDHLGEIWATELPPVPVEGGVISGRLEDLQGRFNLNNLVDLEGQVDPLSLAQLERLLDVLEIDPSFAGVIADWIDADGERGFPNGAEDDAYSGLDPAYRTPNLPITTASELTAVAGMEPEVARLLQPYVTALPVGTSINANTASPVVIASLSDDISLSQAESLVEERGEEDFADVESTFEGLVEDDMLPRIDSVTNYFLLTSTVSIGTAQYTMYSVLNRGPSGVVSAAFRNLGSN